MTDLLKQAMIALEKLPAAEQDALAQHILNDLIEEAKWEESFADPRSEQFFVEMVRLGESEAAQGQLRPAPTLVDE